MRNFTMEIAALTAVTALLASAATPVSAEEEPFFFIHVSDVHAYDHSSEVIEHYGLGGAWLPKSVLAFFILRRYEEQLVPRYSDGILPALRGALGIGPEDESLIGYFDAARYFEELLDPASDLGRAERALRASFEEIRSLGPAFVINTGDIVFDSGKVPADVSDQWAALYHSASDIGIPIEHTIGNHELGYVHHEAADRAAADYGPGWFRREFGPSPRAFSRGAFRFIALDTHSEGEDGEWRFNRMRPEVRDWLERELAEHRDAVTVVMNHEPFFAAPEWKGDEEDGERHVVHEDALLAKHAVDYTVTGHIHLPAVHREGPTTHIANGALSGMHWLLPPDAAPRGYRLFLASGRALHSVFKETGRPALGFVCPSSDPDLFAVCGSASGDAAVVVVAADAAGRFESVSLEASGESIPLVFLGDYFARAERPPRPSQPLVLRARRGTGEVLEATLPARAP